MKIMSKGHEILLWDSLLFRIFKNENRKFVALFIVFIKFKNETPNHHRVLWSCTRSSTMKNNLSVKITSEEHETFVWDSLLSPLFKNWNWKSVAFFVIFLKLENRTPFQHGVLWRMALTFLLKFRSTH